ncbi:hypothetical protein A1A1_08004 [Planococcus antarcticus DSM 14505]|uniref:Uncharacterized protein n=1 Tax=Planococcus antarcticus DSM 14505 TaxID=1185653 RepID=A0AA87IM21_9BACL|nr:hypothetical protein [Planococcus antarcticus]EIM07101.1 hypothetical protein A1A1_08004 [Planococcus antarcticus DSM 14505]
MQVPIRDAELLRQVNDKAEIVIIDNMNHVLKNASADPAENIKTYSNPNLPLAEGLMEGILVFLK